MTENNGEFIGREAFFLQSTEAGRLELYMRLPC